MKVLTVSPEGFSSLGLIFKLSISHHSSWLSHLAKGKFSKTHRKVTQRAEIRLAVFLARNGTFSSGFSLQCHHSTYAFKLEPCLRFLLSNPLDTVLMSMAYIFRDFSSVKAKLLHYPSSN